MTKRYQDVLSALERRAPFHEIYPLLRSLKRSSTGFNDAGINHVDAFGLTICMRAAGHGRLRVVKAACDLGARIEQQNPFTGANILHYAAQQPLGGADIIKWAISQTKEPLLQQRIRVPGETRDRDEDKYWDRGNGHTVAFEAVFNNNVPVVEALLALKGQCHDVDIEKPAVHGLRPLGWALTQSKNPDIVRLLKEALRPNLTDDEAQKEQEDLAVEYAAAKDDEWSKEDRLTGDRAEDIAALELAEKLREYIIDGSTRARSVKDLLDQAGDIDLNKPYGRFGQPLLILVPTHPRIMNMDISERTQDHKDRYTEVVKMLIDRGAKPRRKEKGLMEVSAGFREVFFGYIDALELMIENVEEEAEREDFVNEVGVFNGYTRLIDANLIGNEEAVQLLLDYGADRNIRGFNGWTAGDAARGGNIATAGLTS